MYNFYVSPQGNDKFKGTEKEPFATIERAKKAVRELIENGLDAPVKITLSAGNYITDGLVFDSCDSGTTDFAITYEAQGHVILNGGIKLSADDFTALDDEEKARLHGDASMKVVKTDLKKYGLSQADWGGLCSIGSHSSAGKYDGAILSPMWCELFVNNHRMEIARYPDNEFLYTLEPIKEGQSIQAVNGVTEWEKLRNPIGDIRRIDRETVARAKTWRSLEDVWVFGYPRFGWAYESNPIVSIDFDKCTMETKYVSPFGITENAPYYFFNVFEELDAPGEWFLDRNNGILYLYPPQELKDAEIYLSVSANPIISVNNAENIVFRGLSLTATRGDGIVIVGNNIAVDACDICNVGGWAVTIDGNNCRVSDSHLHHTARGGIFVTGGNRDTLTSSGNIITNNHIHHIAEIFKTYQPGVKIRGVNCVVSHNCIHDSAHQAIGFQGNEHVIEYNEIYNVCTIADDSGAIYAGKDYSTCGNVIRYNYFHDMSSDKETQDVGIFAIYCDDNLGATEIYGNIMHRCQSALLLHGGHDMVFRNNLIIDSCKKSMCSVMIHYYGYPHSLIEGSDDPGHLIALSKVDWKSKLWQDKYPHIAEYLTWDPEKEQIYPHYADISNNIIINHKRIDIDFAAFHKDYKNKICNNIELPCPDFAGINDGNTLDISNNRLSDIIPGFESIPFSEMGQTTRRT